MSRYSSYIVYMDTHGDPSPQPNSNGESLYIQNFCIFDKRHYGEVVIPKIQALKFEHFGHDGFFLSADNIRGLNHQQQFNNDVNDVIEHSNFVLISCVANRAKRPNNSDDNSLHEQMLSFGLDHSYRYLQERDQTDALTYVLATSIDDGSDQLTQQNFRQACAQDDHDLPFELHLTERNHKPLGLQFANLLAAPLLNYFHNPDEGNLGFEILKTKFYCKGGRKKVGVGYEGWGLKEFT